MVFTFKLSSRLSKLDDDLHPKLTYFDVFFSFYGFLHFGAKISDLHAFCCILELKSLICFWLLALAFGSWLLAFGFWLWLLAFGFWLLAFGWVLVL